MKVLVQKIEYVDVEIDLIDFISRRDCEPEFIDLSSPYFQDAYDFDCYPDTNFIIIYQELDGMHELGYILCNEHPGDLKAYIKEHIDEFVPLEE